jgi:hypothetical protein
MPKALRRGGWLLIAIAILALAYHVGNQTSPSIPYEPPSYEPSDLAPPTPITDDTSAIESGALPAGGMKDPGNRARRARIISITAVQGNRPLRMKTPVPPTFFRGHTQKQKPIGIHIVEVRASPKAEPSPKTSNHWNDFAKPAGAKRQASAAESPTTVTTPAVNHPKMLPLISPDIQPNITLSRFQTGVWERESRPLPTSGELPRTNTSVTPKPGPTPQTAVESIGVVFLESPRAALAGAPRELPTSVMESAPLLATQKLIARSLGSPTGVAARLANFQGNSPRPSKGQILLASAEMEADQSRLRINDAALKPYTTTGVVNFRASKEEIAAQAHLDYVSSGLVILPASEEPTITAPTSVQEFLVKNAIRQACGDKIKDLQVNLEPSRCLKIRLNAANQSDQEHLNRTILALPELASYRISLSVEAKQ